MFASASEVRRHRRQEIANLTLTELLISMVFILLLTTYYARESGLQQVSQLEAMLEQARRERDQLALELKSAHAALVKAQEEVRRLDRALRDANETIARLAPRADTVRPDPAVLMGERDKAIRERDALRLLVDQQQKDIAQLQRKLAQEGRGVGKPKCTVTPGPIVKVILEDGGTFRVSQAWEAGTEEAVSSVPGLVEFASKATSMSVSEFREFSDRIYRWGDQQSIACRFVVDVVVSTRDLATYRNLMKVVDAYYYPRGR